MDAAYDAVNVLIMWNILYTDNDVRYVLMYILYGTHHRQSTDATHEWIYEQSFIYMGIKKDHGIVDNGHTKRWCYRDIPWFI